MILSVFFFQREHGQIAEEIASNVSLIKYAYDVTWLTHRSRGNLSSHKRLQWRSTEERHMRTVAGKNTLYQQHLYSPKISMHVYKPKKLNE